MAFRYTLRFSHWQRIGLKTGIHLLAFGWLCWTFWLGVQDRLGADPVNGLLHFTGFGAINLLLITLSLSTVSRYLGGELMRFRRLIGIYTFVYALCHLLTFAVFILGLDINRLGNEIADRPYITVGFSAVIILLALTITSPNRIRKNMGRHWQQLHNLVYIALFLMLLHFTWAEKTPWGTPVYYWILGAAIMLPKAGKIKRLLIKKNLR
ncbi:sulfoxide reductase heme-binding subunit YedZ [Vibrio sp. CAIM 722]|uniref:Protein-methionine-sulfoxide reductase heme-binding subunit MsrQ n=1 Tax=Vibrio eleionomae TaxID=2653505 RepID=A0A7X4LNQ9_9VIBR|nr:protein-methionine-sulfoxide reductase heme-binding subunit MsrQ [Vibrio eleionomae]MZI95343.1 sulfoxide reductase heme-binding subunit YedZ [Vibrio eleionomae]